MLDYLWAGAADRHHAGDSFADLIESKGLGITVPAGDVEALEEALFRLLDDEAAAAECRARLAEVMPDHAWSRVLAPVVEFCRAPRRAADLAAPVGSENMAELAEAVTRRPRCVTRWPWPASTSEPAARSKSGAAPPSAFYATAPRPAGG